MVGFERVDGYVDEYLALVAERFVRCHADTCPWLGLYSTQAIQGSLGYHFSSVSQISIASALTLTLPLSPRCEQRQFPQCSGGGFKDGTLPSLVNPPHVPNVTCREPRRT